MTAEEIREISIDSAINYYDYLIKNGKGIQIVDVNEIEYLQSRDLIIKLRLSAKLFDTDSIFFKLLTNDKQYDSSQVKVIDYDADKNILLVKVQEEIASHFRNVRSQDIKVISDLKFLVQRVKDWYEKNGAKLSLPTKASSLKASANDIKYLENFPPSTTQKQSLSNIFNNPFSYVWGAPGTGKTQYVLAYAVLHYISNNKKVAILAPTNNAVEQVLRGVIKMLDLAGIDRKKIIRLGTPSRKFAEEFPEVCEEKGVQKKLEEIDKQISILERVISHEVNYRLIKEAKQNLLLFDNIETFKSSFPNTQWSLDNAKSDLKKLEIDLRYLSEDFQSQLNKKQLIQKKINSLIHKAKKIFSSKTTKEESELLDIEELIIKKAKQKELLLFNVEEFKKTLREKEQMHNQYISAVSNLINGIKEKFRDVQALKEIVDVLSVENWQNIKQQVVLSIEREGEKYEEDSNMFSEYQNHPISELLGKHQFYLASRSKLAKTSTDERVNSVNVVACTLDGYIGRYTESQLNVEHFFLDEAGYANIIKALTLFNRNIPVSFLGDHMQLPPVCEINDKEIQNEERFKNMFLWSQSAIYLETLFNADRDVALDQYLNSIDLESRYLSKTSLNLTFRFGSNLARILASHVYPNNFHSSNPEGQTKIVFINAPKIDPTYGRISITEVQAIKKITQHLTSIGTDYVILTPYKKQIKLLGTHLPQERNDLKILTVHGSQGREWNTVILSVVDTSDMFFVKSTLKIGLKLVNTAVSRAEKQLIIVCDKNYWIHQNGQLITDLIREGNELTI